MSTGTSLLHDRLSNNFRWLPTDSLKYCLVHTQCKLLIVDHERAVKLEPILSSIYTENDLSGALILDCPSHEPLPRGTESYHDVLEHYSGEVQSVLAESYPYIHPEDNAAIMFTSGRICSQYHNRFKTRHTGTTGLPKGVLSTQRQFLTNVLNVRVFSDQAVFRRMAHPGFRPSLAGKGLLYEEATILLLDRLAFRKARWSPYRFFMSPERPAIP